MDGAGVLDEVDLVALRRAAVMAHAVAGLTIRLRSGRRTLATVARLPGAGPASPGHPAGRLIDACGFRMAVAAAWADHRNGRRVAVRPTVGADTELDADLQVDWSIAEPGRLLGFGGVRTACGGRLVWAAPSMLSPELLGAVLEEVTTGDAGRAPAPTPVIAVLDDVVARVSRDELLGASVLSVEIDPAAYPERTTLLFSALDEVVRRLVAASGAAEVATATTPVG